MRGLLLRGRTPLAPVVIVLTAAGLGACGLLPTGNRPEVRQGNILTAEDLERLEPGQSRAHVRELIGNPVLRGSFRSARWDYIYYRVDGGAAVEDPQRLTLLFDGDRLDRVVDRYDPPSPPDPGERDRAPLPATPGPAPAQPADGPDPTGGGSRMPGPY